MTTDGGDAAGTSPNDAPADAPEDSLEDTIWPKVDASLAGISCTPSVARRI